MRNKPKVKLHTRYACWGLLPEHVRRLRPEWSEEQALDFLYKHQSRIASAMTRLGWMVLAQTLQEPDEGDER